MHSKSKIYLIKRRSDEPLSEYLLIVLTFLNHNSSNETKTLPISPGQDEKAKTPFAPAFQMTIGLRPFLIKINIFTQTIFIFILALINFILPIFEYIE